MLRPKDVFEWFKARSELNRNEIGQLVDGLMPGGQIVIGGAEANVAKMMPVMSNMQRIGRLVSINNAKLDVKQPTTFDTAAVLQLIMIAKNENFFQTIELAVKLLEDADKNGLSLAAAAEILRNQAQKVAKL